MKQQTIPSPNIFFKPVPNSSQELALDSRADQTLLCGSRGGMKTATQLMAFRRYCGLGYGQFWRGVIIDREYKHLSDVISQGKKFFLPFNDCRFMSGTGDCKFVWETGETLELRHAKTLDDYDQFHGKEYSFIGFNELTKHPTLELYDKIISTNRSSFLPEKDTPLNDLGEYNTPDRKPLPPIPLRVFSTCNPSGAGHNCVRKRFIDPAPYGQVVERWVDIFNPQTGEEDRYRKTQVAIFASYKENPFLSASYAAELASIQDPMLRKAWEEGSWEITSGGALDDLWDRNIHILPEFKIPSYWRVTRNFDWGSSHPFAVIWKAECNGEDSPEGYSFPKGTIIVFNEWYGCLDGDITTNKGLKLSAKDIAKGIIGREKQMIDRGIIFSMPLPGAADNQISQVREKDVETIEKKMADHGVKWLKSDKSPGSRVHGLQLIRDRLQASVEKEGKGLYFTHNCKFCIETIPTLPRSEKNHEDVDSDCVDHLYDAVRYGVLEGQNRIVMDLQVDYF